MNILIAGSGNKFRMTHEGKYDYVIAADGGLHFLTYNGIIPDVLIGDLDSVKEDVLQSYQDEMEIIPYSPEKDFTDLELALEFAIKKKPGKITLVGITGIRLDHVLNNLTLAYDCFQKGTEIELLDFNNCMFFRSKGNYKLSVPEEYQYFSLLPWRQDVRIKKMTNVKYPLENALLKYGRGLGISNECLEERTFILEVEDGDVLVIYSHEKKSIE